VGCREIEFGTDGDDARRIDVVVRLIIMALNVIEVDGLGNALNLIEVAEVSR